MNFGEYSVVFFIIVALISVGINFADLDMPPKDKHLASLREWLLWAVTEAERLLGGGTGELKLAMVYEKFLTTFPWLAKVVGFELFKQLVDEALEKMRVLIESNHNVSGHIANSANTKTHETRGGAAEYRR